MKSVSLVSYQRQHVGWLTKLPVITFGANARIERFKSLVVQIPSLQELIACLSEARLIFVGAVLSNVRDVEDGDLDTV